MTRKRKLIVGIGSAVVVAVAALGGWYFLSMSGGDSNGGEWIPGETDIAESDGSDGGEWIPEISSDISDPSAEDAETGEMRMEEPSPAQEMVGAPLYEGAPVEVSSEMIQTLGVRMERVRRRELVETIRSVGRIDYDERTIAVVTSRLDGRVERLFVDFTGAEVRKGEPLLTIYSPQLVSSQREYLIALRASERLETIDPTRPHATMNHHASSLKTASRERLKLWGITNEQIARIETDGVTTESTVHAPQSGTVLQKSVTEGAYVREGSALYTIADLSTVWAYVDVYESDLGSVRRGQEVALTMPAYLGEQFTGKVTFIDPTVNRETRTVRVRAEFANSSGRLKPGMFANAELRSSLGNVVAVPENAVIHSGKRSFVLKSLGGGRFQPVEVEHGRLAQGYYAVARGVKEGETVVTSANFLIDAESNLREAFSNMAPMQELESAPTSELEPAPGQE